MLHIGDSTDFAVPKSFKDLTKMRASDLSYNQMTGDIDFTKDYNIGSLALNNNAFSGDLGELWNKTTLELINCGDNQFSGSISPDIGQMVNLLIKRASAHILIVPMLSDVRSSNSF